MQTNEEEEEEEEEEHPSLFPSINLSLLEKHLK